MWGSRVRDSRQAHCSLGMPQERVQDINLMKLWEPPLNSSEITEVLAAFYSTQLLSLLALYIVMMGPKSKCNHMTAIGTKLGHRVSSPEKHLNWPKQGLHKETGVALNFIQQLRSAGDMQRRKAYDEGGREDGRKHQRSLSKGGWNMYLCLCLVFTSIGCSSTLCHPSSSCYPLGPRFWDLCHVAALTEHHLLIMTLLLVALLTSLLDPFLEHSLWMKVSDLSQTHSNWIEVLLTVKQIPWCLPLPLPHHWRIWLFSTVWCSHVPCLKACTPICELQPGNNCLHIQTGSHSCLILIPS